MKSDARWMRILAIRVLANAVVGGFWFAFVGACCCGAAGAFLTFLISVSVGEFGIGMAFGKLTVVDATLGFASGIMGAFIFAIAAWRTTPGHLLSPFYELKLRVFLGQVLGTFLVCISFFSFVFIKMKLQNINLAYSTGYDGVYLLFGAPILMICGAIAAALTKRDLPKVATLKTE